MDTAKVAVHERVPRLGLVGCAVGESEVPVGVLGPGVTLELVVLSVGVRLHLSPVAVEDIWRASISRRAWATADSFNV